MRALVLLFGVLAACTVKNPDFCASDADCAGTPRPFCDVNGEFQESNGTRNICITTPDDCPIERCGCTPGTPLACDLDHLTVCADDGKSTVTETCALGCSTEDRCLTFEPSNGLGPALDMAADAPDTILPDGARIDTELGTVVGSDGSTIPVSSLVVTNAGGPQIRAILGNTITVGSVTLVGSLPVAFVARGRISIGGQLDASADKTRGGPGAQESPAACVGGQAQERQNGAFTFGGGGAGGGGATDGGEGGSLADAAGGAPGRAVTAAMPLLGGCRGGRIAGLDGSSTVSSGGGGGGAVQLTSDSEVVFSNTGLINLGGGGGEDGGGGGSGGLLVIEAPRVRFEGASTGIAANGGAGGGCGLSGSDATPDRSPALAPKQNCSTIPQPGNGATAVLAPEPGKKDCGSGSCLTAGFAGGGGGAVGRALISTRSGDFEAVGTPILSVDVSKGQLAPR